MKEFGSHATRNKRNDIGARRFVRALGTGFVLRPACACTLPFATHIGDPLICSTCGGARLTSQDTEEKRS